MIINQVLSGMMCDRVVDLMDEDYYLVSVSQSEPKQSERSLDAIENTPNENKGWEGESSPHVKNRITIFHPHTNYIDLC